MIPPIHREPERDPRIAGELQRVAGRDVNGDELLVRRIVAAAQPRLSAMREVSRPWWEWTASWARYAVPAGLAACLVGGVLAVRASDLPGGDAAITERALVLGGGDASNGATLAAELLPQPTAEWLITEAFDR